MEKYFLKIFVLLVLIFITACSSSSSSMRYGKITEVEKEESKSERFTSNDDEKKVELVEEEILDEFDEQPPAVNPELRNQLFNKTDKYSDFSAEVTEREKILFEIIKYIDTPYKYGGNDFNGIDCSGFTFNVFSNSSEMVLPRSANQQFKIGEKIESKDELQFGDLVFFNTTKRSFPGHVGIYVGENLFAHASRTLGVTISSLTEEYYVKRYVGGRRIKAE